MAHHYWIQQSAASEFPSPISQLLLVRDTQKFLSSSKQCMQPLEMHWCASCCACNLQFVAHNYIVSCPALASNALPEVFVLAAVKPDNKRRMNACHSSGSHLQGPILVSLTSLATYTLLGNKLTAAVAFPALALFDLLSQPVNYIPMIITELASARVALGRISSFLAEPELQEHQERGVQQGSSRANAAISIQQGTFSWAAGKSHKPFLPFFGLLWSKTFMVRP